MNSNHGVFLNNRHISWLVSLVLLFTFFAFMGGYFLGKHKQIMQPVVPEYTHPLIASMQEVPVEESDTPPVCNNTGQEGETTVVSSSQKETVGNGPQKTYYAQLIGFGSKNAAQSFLQRLTTRGVPVLLQERVSKTAAGVSRTWYQVITASFTNQQELSTLVEKLVKEEKLHDVRIISS